MARYVYKLPELPWKVNPRKRPPQPTLPERETVWDYRPGKWYYLRKGEIPRVGLEGKRGLFYWEDPQRVARYINVIDAQPPGTPPFDWLDEGALRTAYNALRDYNKNEPWWNWQPLPFKHPVASTLRRMQAPPLPLLESMGEEEYYTPTEEEQLPSPALAGMTDEQWEQLPRWQRFLVSALQSPAFGGGMGAVAGAPLGFLLGGPVGGAIGAVAGGAAGAWAQTHPEGTMASLLSYLDYPREWVEQLLGIGAQIYGAKTQPEKYGELPEWDELLKWLRAAREAGSIYTSGWTGFQLPGSPGTFVETDVLNLLAQLDISLDEFLDIWYPTPPGLEKVAEPGQIWMPGQAEPVEAPDVAAAMYDIRNRILQGGKPEELIAEYMEQYGLSGRMREMVMGFAIDPLNWAPVVLPKGVSGVARMAGAEDLAHAMGTSHGVIEGIQKYGTLLRAERPISEIIGAEGVFAPVQRWLAGVSKTGDIKVLKPATELRGGVFGYLTNMKPQSRATEVLNTSAVNLGMILSQVPDPTAEDLIRIIKSLANTPDDVARELSMRSILSPDAAAIPMFLRDFSDTADEFLLKWEATAAQRRLLANIGEATGKTPGEVLQMVADAPDAEVLLRQFVDAARERGMDNIVRGYEDARAAVHQLDPSQHVTVDKIQDMVKVFVDDQLPHDLDTFRGQLYAAAIDHAADWSVKWFGVEPDPRWVRTSQMIKSAQSLMLLGLNPTYLVNNALNNLVTSAATGVFGIRSMETINNVWKRAGITPPRLRAGVGPVALGTEINYAAIRKAMKAPGMLTDITRFFNEKTRKIQVFSNLSMKAEQFGSAQAYTAGFLQFMGRHWKPGVGFKRMPAALERMLTSINPDLPKLVYGAIQGGLNQVEIETALWGGLSRRTLDSTIPTLAESLRTRGVNLSDADISELLRHSGIDELLREKLARAKTDEDVRNAFGEANRIVQDNLDRMVAQDLEREAAEVAGRMSTEGLPAVLELFDQRQIEFTERWFENFAEWEDAFTKTENMEYGERSAVLRGVAAQQQQKWNRFYTSERAKYQAIVNGLGIGGEDNRRIIDFIDQSQRNYKEFFELRNRRNAEFFDQIFDNATERRVAWDTLQEELMEAYNDMTSREMHISEELDSLMVRWMGTKYGDEAAQAATAWRTGVNEIRHNMIQEMRAMREALRQMPVDERRSAWLTFLHGRDGYLQQIAQYFRRNVDGAHDLYNQLRGRAGEVPAPAPEAPEGPLPTAGMPVMITNEMRARLRGLGFTDDQIAQMAPQQAWDNLAAAGAEPVPMPEVPPTPEAPAPPVEPVEALSPVGRRVKVAFQGETFYGVVDAPPQPFETMHGRVYIRVRPDNARASSWYPLNSVEGLEITPDPVVVPNVQPPSTTAVFAENARIAAEAGIPLIDEEGKIISGAEIHLMNALKKYGGPEAQQYTRLEDVPSDILQKAIEVRAQEKAGFDKVWGREAIEAMMEEISPTPEVSPRKQEIVDTVMRGNITDLPDELHDAAIDTLHNMYAEVDIAEKGFQIWKEQVGAGGTAEITGVKSTYPDWYEGLGSKGYTRNVLDEAGNIIERQKFTAKKAVLEAIGDIIDGTESKRKYKGEMVDYALVKGIKSEMLTQLEEHRAYQIYTGLVNTSKQVNRLFTLKKQAANFLTWDNPERLSSILESVNEVIADLSDYNYEDVRYAVDKSLEIQNMLQERIRELSQVPPEELTHLVEDARRQANIDISTYESGREVHDFQMGSGVEPSELFNKGDIDNPYYTAAVKAGIYRRDVRQKLIDLFLAQQPEVISGAWDAQLQADKIMALTDAHANVWAKATGRQPHEWYETHFADIVQGPVDVTEDPYLLGQIARNKKTEGYKAFAEGNACVDENGDLIVVYHGTTHTFSEFNLERAEVENLLGQAFYFTDSVDDVNANYAGLGATHRERMKTLAEYISEDLSFNMAPYQNEVMQFFGLTPDEYFRMAETGELFDLIDGDPGVFDFIARKRVGGDNEGVVMPVFLKIENPALLEPGKGTWMPFDPDNLKTLKDAIGEAIKGRITTYMVSDEAALERIMETLGHEHLGGGYLADIINTLIEKTDISTAAVAREGMANVPGTNLIISDILRNLGYDGAIMEAGAYFPDMVGVAGAKHYVVWDPTHVKSVFNMGDFDITNPDIYYQRSFRVAPAQAGAEMSAVNVSFREATDWAAGRFDETVVPILESEGGAYAIAEDPVGGYVLDSVWSGQNHYDTLHEARTAAWEEAFRRAREYPEETMFQEVQLAQPNYYSKVRQLIVDEMPGQMKNADLWKLIESGDIHPAELEWTGVRDWLEGKELIKKDEILRFLDEEKEIPEGLPLYMQKKGAVQFMKDGRAVLQALESPDISTVVHELGHIFRYDLRQMIDGAMDETIKAGLLKDWKTASKWAGAILDDDGEFLWSGEAAYRYGMDSLEYATAKLAEEKFARGFEEYLMMGVAPSPELVSVFERFKEWLAHIYAHVRGKLAGVTPKMKEVYDRLLVEYPEAADYPITTEMGRAKVPTQGNMFQPAPAENTENFRQWFRHSAVSEPDGTPMGVYHGTPAAFLEFDPQYARDIGFHFGTREQAQRRLAFTRHVRTTAQPENILEVYLSIQNPLRVTDLEWRGESLRGLVQRVLDPLARERVLAIQSEIDEVEAVLWWIEKGHPEMSSAPKFKLQIQRQMKKWGAPSIDDPFFYTYLKNQVRDQATLYQKLNAILIEELEDIGYDGLVYENQVEGVGDSWVAFRPTQIKSVRNSGEWSPIDPNIYHQTGLPLEYENGYRTNILYQEELPEPTSPLGEVEGNNPSPPLSKIQEEGFRNYIRPILSGLENLMTGPEAQLPSEVANIATTLDPSSLKMLRAYMGEVYGNLADTKLGGMRWAENRRDAALLNYSRRYGFDNVITAMFPYQFWYTRTALQWAMRFIDKPGWMSNYARIRNFQRGTIASPGFPSRLINKMKMPVPFLPDWAGGGIYIDPFRQFFPFEQYARPWEQRAREQSLAERRAESLLQQWSEDGDADPQAVKDALETRDGDLWNKALTQAQLGIESEANNPWDFINLIMSPSLPIGWGYEWARGTQDRIGQMPATRLIQNVSGALGANQGRGWNIEGPIRRLLGMPEYDRWHDYSVDRALADMVAEGSVSPEDGALAMTDQAGPAYLAAQQRVAQEKRIEYLGLPLGADLFPEGEQKQRALSQEYDRAREAWLGGQSDALQTFFDKYPEYESRMLLFKDEPEERLRAFLRSSIWDAWFALPDLHRQQLAEQLGDVFTQAFLNKETRSYDSIDTPTLAQWAKVMKGVVPKTAPETPEAQVQLATVEEAEAYQAYTNERDEKFPGIGEILEVIYEAPEEVRDQYYDMFPEVDAYYQWRNRYFAEHPEILPYAISDQSKMAGAPQDVQVLYYQFQAQRDQMFPGIFETQDQYYQIDPANKSAKKAFREKHPELVGYWEWRRDFMRQYPNLIPYLMSEEALAEAVLGEEYQATPGRTSSQGIQYNLDINQLDPVLVRKLVAYYMLGEPLGTGGQKALQQFWEVSGKPGKSLQEFLDEILVNEF
jgi:hypothetical protein